MLLEVMETMVILMLLEVMVLMMITMGILMTSTDGTFWVIKMAKM
jgi:hypothetical protein